MGVIHLKQDNNSIEWRSILVMAVDLCPLCLFGSYIFKVIYQKDVYEKLKNVFVDDVLTKHIGNVLWQIVIPPNLEGTEVIKRLTVRRSVGVMLCLKLLPQFLSHLNEACYTCSQ